MIEENKIQIIQKIQEMKEYILLADKLQDRIDNPNVKKAISMCSKDLEGSVMVLELTQKTLQKFDSVMAEADQVLAEIPEEKTDKIEYSSEYEPYIASAKAKAYGFASYIAACFSRESSKSFLKKKDEYNQRSKDLVRLIQIHRGTKRLQGHLKRLQDHSIRMASKREFAEARALENFRKKLPIPIDDDIAYDMINQPELFIYAVLENIKEEYAPEL